MDKAVRVIHRTQALSPHGYIVHLDGKVHRRRDRHSALAGRLHSSLEILSEEVEPREALRENLEDQHPEMIDAILARTTVSCCVDVGHLWKKGKRPSIATRQVDAQDANRHIHGVGKRDHKSLSFHARR